MHSASDSFDAPIELSLILMDWEMPIMNGLTAVAKIRELEQDGLLNGRVPVIGVTANVRQQQIETAMQAGMDDVVGKPFRVAELLARRIPVTAPPGEIGDVIYAEYPPLYEAVASDRPPVYSAAPEAGQLDFRSAFNNDSLGTF